MNRRWLVNRTNPEFLRYLSNKASISTAFAQILVNRGIKDADSIKDFLSPSLKNLHDPFLLPDMKKAVERINTALDRDEVVFVHGDYDADGITSTALLVSALRSLGLKIYYHIPDRITEGYGVSNTGIQKAKACNTRLIITADCGISSASEVSTALSLGMDVIITDHHEPPVSSGDSPRRDELPEATAVINPHRVDSEYPFKYLAGVGVAYKLIEALFHETRNAKRETRLESFLDLVAIGTIADSVPLTGENRTFVVYGLKELNNGPCRVGIQALKEAANINREFRSKMLSYTLIPRINAAGRLGDATEVVELLLIQDEARAKGIASHLEEQNKRRQKIEGDVFKAALNIISQEPIDNAIVLSSPDWHPGVIGIVASRLVDMFYRPVFLFSIKDSVAKGSARSIRPFHLYKGIAECTELLLGFGGHSQAAGLRLLAENLSGFREKINRIVEKSLSSDDMLPTLEIDASVELSEINFNFVRELSLLEPYGNSNKEPIFGAKGIEFSDHRIVGNNHLKMRSKQKNINIDTIGFSMGNLLEQNGLRFTVHGSRFVDIAFVPCINEWNGTKSLQLNLKALRPSD